MSDPVVIRPIRVTDRASWNPLWDGYNKFYGRHGDTALSKEITETTWQRFFDLHEPVHALVAVSGEQLLGLAHYLFHRSTTRIPISCYLHDLYTDASARGRGVGRALIHGVYEQARLSGSNRVYWQTHVDNATARALYDKVAVHAGFLVYAHEV